MKITIQRIRINDLTIDGHLSIDNIKVCDTAESAINCLPNGVYKICIDKCAKANRRIPRISLQNKPCCCKCCKIEESRFEIYGKEFDALYDELSQKYLDAGYQAVIDDRKAAFDAGQTTRLQ